MLMNAILSSNTSLAVLLIGEMTSADSSLLAIFFLVFQALIHFCNACMAFRFARERS